MVDDLIFEFEWMILLDLTVQKILNDYKSVTYTGPSPRQRTNHRTISYNFYPIEEQINQFFNQIKGEMVTFFNLWGKNAEILFFDQSRGTITDMENETFIIDQACHWECYFYESESSAYCRLLNERDIARNIKWLSLDMDFIEKSAWFEDS